MDIAQAFESRPMETIKSIDMHTTGEPTRIIYSGFPALHGTLLSQRGQAKEKYDHIRSRIMLEPRGHFDMYGAIIRPETELVASGQAHVGVLFTHNGGFSTMCGHATLALGRFLVDTHDLAVFPKRNELKPDPSTQTVSINLHAPCGLVQVTVPTSSDGQSSDPSRPVSFLSIPAFATAAGIKIPIPPEAQWPELTRSGRDSIVLDVSYGGTFYVLVTAQELGFSDGLKGIDLDAMGSCIRLLKPYLSAYSAIATAVQHPQDERLSFLYSVMVVDADLGVQPPGTAGAETGLCYFADHQIDRSPTGSCVVARMALAHAKGIRPLGQRWAYHSLVSNSFGTGAFIAEVVEKTTLPGGRDYLSEHGVVVKVEGQAHYVGSSTFIVEKDDPISTSGFSMTRLT